MLVIIIIIIVIKKDNIIRDRGIDLGWGDDKRIYFFKEFILSLGKEN